MHPELRLESHSDEFRFNVRWVRKYSFNQFAEPYRLLGPLQLLHELRKRLQQRNHMV